jgi:hypothetical protein
LILMFFFCILIFLSRVVLLFLKSHFWPFTEVVRKIGREVTRKSDGPRVVWRTGCNQQRNRPCALCFAFLVWYSVRARHTAIADTAVRPSQGRRSRNVITMVALS